MSSKPIKRREPRSIASQLVLLFTSAAALLLLCSLGVFYWIVVRHAFEEDNAFLADKISALRADLDQRGAPEILNETLNPGAIGEHETYWVRIVDSSGRAIAQTSGMDGLLPGNIFPAAQNSSPSVQHPLDYRTNGKLFSLVAITAAEGGKRYTIQIAQDRSEDDEFTREYGALLAVVMAFGILAAALIAITVTKRGLRPLAQMTRSLKLIGPSHLNERVSPAGWPRELQPLAGAFDDMLDRLEDSFTRLSQFSADLAHELRTPIANLRGEAEVALRRPRTLDEYREIIESSVGECERLSGIIDNLLFLARAEAADGQIERRLFDGRAAIEKIAIYYRTIAEERHVAITCSGEGRIYADPVLFGRAVSNLVENALRFTPESDTIAISIVKHSSQCEISVRDNGCGMAAVHVSRVFDRFYRADSSRSSPGTGLGLALVKSITDLHSGSARVESEVNRGTIVTLIFPNEHGFESNR